MNVLRRLWKDPVWATAIGTVIAAAILAAAGFSWAERRHIAEVALALWRWGTADAQLSRLQVIAWALFGCVVGVAGSYRMAIQQIRRAATAAIRTVALTTLNEATNQSSKVSTLDENTPVVDGFKPSDKQAKVLVAMMRTYPIEIDLQEAHAKMGTVTPAHAEKEMELLGAANVVRIRRVSENATYYRVTAPGRDFMLQWLEPAQ